HKGVVVGNQYPVVNRLRGVGLRSGGWQWCAAERGFLLKERTPFTGRGVLIGRAAAKFPAPAVMANALGRIEGSDDIAFVPPRPVTHVWVHSVDAFQSGWPEAAGRGAAALAARFWIR